MALLLSCRGEFLNHPLEKTTCRLLDVAWSSGQASWTICMDGCSNAMIRSDAAPKIQAGRTFRVGRDMQYVSLPMKDESAEQSHIDRTNSSNILHARTTSRV